MLESQANRETPRMLKINLKGTSRVSRHPATASIVASSSFSVSNLRRPLILFLLCVEDQDTGRRRKNGGSRRGWNEGNKAHHCQNAAKGFPVISDFPCSCSPRFFSPQALHIACQVREAGSALSPAAHTCTGLITPGWDRAWLKPLPTVTQLQWWFSSPYFMELLSGARVAQMVTWWGNHRGPKSSSALDPWFPCFHKNSPSLS